MDWYVVHTKPKREELAESSLERLGVETFFPQLKEDRIIRRRRQTSVGPLFPGYLFARFDLQRQFRAVNFAGGVHRLVTFGPQLAAVDETVIGSLRSRLEDGYVVVRPAPLLPGQPVRITAGPLRGIEAVFDQPMRGSERVVVLLRTLAQQSRVVLARDEVAPA